MNVNETSYAKAALWPRISRHLEPERIATSSHFFQAPPAAGALEALARGVSYFEDRARASSINFKTRC